MKSKSRLQFHRFIIVAVFVCLLMGGCAGQDDVPPPAPIDVSVLFFNDLHGHLLPFEIKTADGVRQVGGIARVATLIRRIREHNNAKQIRTVVLVAGDILQGTPMSTVFKGAPDVKCLNAMGVDAMTVGNHEFDFGLENFQKLAEAAQFPFLSANIVEKRNGAGLCRAFLTIPLADDGLALTVIGVTTQDLLITTKAENVAALDVLDPVSAVERVFSQVKRLGPVLVLSHCKHQTDRSIARAVPDIAAIIGGHDQILLSPYRRVGDVPVFQAFEKGRYLGRIDLRIDPRTKKAELVGNAYLPITADIPPDPDIAAIVTDYDARLGDTFKAVIGRAGAFLDGDREHVRYQETPLGNFVADIMVAHTGAEIGLINAGALRASIKAGPVTVADVFKAMPYGNELMVVRLTGKEIEKVLQRAARGLREDEDGGFLHVSGLAFDIRDRRPENIRVGRDRTALNPMAAYDVVITDFMADGGDGYTLFRNKSKIATGLPLRELMVDTFRRQPVVTARVEGRIRRVE